MTKPTRRKRAESEGAREKIVVSEAALCRAATSYAAVAGLDHPSRPKWRRAWRELRRAAIEMVAEIPEEADGPEGPPHAASRSGRPPP